MVRYAESHVLAQATPDKRIINRINKLEVFVWGPLPPLDAGRFWTGFTSLGTVPPHLRGPG